MPDENSSFLESNQPEPIEQHLPNHRFSVQKVLPNSQKPSLDPLDIVVGNKIWDFIKLAFNFHF